MEFAGLGVDIIEIDRMKRALDRSPHFKERVFSEGERSYCDAKVRPEVHYALRFAAKEAVLKALGTGFGQGVNVTDVEVTNNRYGKPEVILTGGALDIAHSQGVKEMHLSLSYTHDVGVANAVAITEDVQPVIDETKDPQAELAAAFKTAKTMMAEMDEASPSRHEDSTDVSDADDAETDDASKASQPHLEEDR